MKSGDKLVSGACKTSVWGSEMARAICIRKPCIIIIHKRRDINYNACN